MEQNLYKFAAQNNLRFPSIKGLVTVEDLFDCPLKAKNGYDLDSIAKSIFGSLKALNEESFVGGASSPAKKTLEISLDIVKDVIATIQEENANELKKKEKAEKRRLILDILGDKKNQELQGKSVAELEAELAALD